MGVDGKSSVDVTSTAGEDEASASTFEMIPIDDSKGDVYGDISASLPSPEDIRATLQSESTQGPGKRKRWLLALGCLVVLVAVVVALAITLPKKDSSGSVSTARTSSEAFEATVAYLESRDISDIDSLRDNGSPQNRAAFWIAEDDPGKVAVPWTNATAEEHYIYISRYIIAVNYYALSGEKWESQLNFLSADDICQWHHSVLGGLVCEDQENGKRPMPVQLHIHNANLVGQIPKENGHLTTLKSIDLLFNALTGSIPTELCSIDSLIDLQLSHNQLTGVIPSCLGDLALEDLFLYDNMFDGTIPMELCRISTLRGLSLGANNLHGNIPNCLGGLDMLDSLYLNTNQLQGSLPTEIGNLKNLVSLEIDDNRLTGNPTAVFNALANLQYLDANHNKLTGELGLSFLANSGVLLQADLSHNEFTFDTFPAQLLSLPFLQLLDLSKNKLRGNLPSTIDLNPELLSLSLYGNELAGRIPTTIKNLVNLEHLDLSDNNFSGPLPSEIGEMMTLKYLFLSNNLFAGSPLPTSFANLKKLQELSLRNTNRAGALPGYIGSLTMLDLLDLGSNQFTGQIPDSYGNLVELKYLLLSNNTISGDIPMTLGNLQELVGVYLDRTGLTGNLDALCSIPFLWEDKGEGVIYADCGGAEPKINCNCGSCECCDLKDAKSCSDPGLANIDDIEEVIFGQRHYDLEPEDEGKDQVSSP